MVESRTTLMLNFKTIWEHKAHYRAVLRIEHHLVWKMADVLDRIARSDVTVKGESQELLRKLTLLDVLGKRGVMEMGSRNQVLGSLSPTICFWISSSSTRRFGMHHSQCHTLWICVEGRQLELGAVGWAASALLVHEGCCHGRESFAPAHDLTSVVVFSCASSLLEYQK